MFNTKPLILALAIASPFFAASSQAAEAKPSVVIVHGAFADGSDWAKVVPLLQDKGIKVTVVQNPLTSLADDVAATQRVLNNQEGDVVLVGHSWGGTVISQAGADEKVHSLVYVAAFAPNAGQSTGELYGGYRTAPGSSQIVADSNGFLYLTPQGMATDFAQDLSAKQTAIMTATQGPIRAAAFKERTSVAAWQQKPSWYIVASDDRMIVPEMQRDFARKIGANTSELAASHVPQQSRPAEVAKVIIDAVQQSSTTAGK